MKPLALVTGLFCFASSAFAQQQVATNGDSPSRPAGSGVTGVGATVANATRAAKAPVLDGRTDDEIWTQAQVIDQFLEYEPNEGAQSRFRTEARVAYDDRYLYVLVRMFDPRPDSIVSLLSRRDVRTNSEQVKIVVDSYHDRRTAYQFAVNPAGVKRDYYVYNDAVEDDSWDAVWDVGTSIDSLGWVAEYRIPFSQLRFASKPEHTFGLLIVRDIARTGARISWPLYHRNQQGYVSQAGEIHGIRGIPTPRRLEVTPYTVARSEPETRDDGFGRKQALTVGADVKYGLSSNLTVDATINPDFGQVESDPAVLNLSAFETFLQERRPFFLEGTGIFNFNINCGDIDEDCTGLFYSRRIGRNPQLTDIFGDERSPSSTTILGAAKLTGRLGNGLSMGLLDATTQREHGAADQTIEPTTNYLVGRLQQDLNSGQTGIGAMVTAVNRDLDDVTLPYLRRRAYAGGVDVRHRFFDKKYEVAAYVAGSRVDGSADAIALLQQCNQFGCAHSYQRPDDNLDYDPTRTALQGHAERVSVSKFGGGVTRFQSVYQRYSPGFEINDVGFLARADEQMFRNWFSIQIITPRAFYRRAFLNFNHGSTWTSEGLPTSLGVNFNGHVELKNTWWAHLGANTGNFGGTFSDRDSRGGPAVRRSRDQEVWGGMEGDRRWHVQPMFFAGAWSGDAGRSHGAWVDPALSIRASSRFSARVGLNMERAVNDNQFRGNFGAIGADTTHYTFARLYQTTINPTARFSVTATPALSLQVYAQPFVTTGDYSNWRELDDPRARSYTGRYRPFAQGGDPGGFNFKQLRSNSVVRWEYRPGSTLFLVWTQGREDFLSGGSRLDVKRDYDNLFKLRPENTLLVKASYWVNF